MKVSIAMATYNGGQFLDSQLNSIANQSRAPDELVVCDDGSSDATLELLRGFSDRVSFSVRVYQNDLNLGHEQNFSNALGKCTGDLVFLSDQDDVWYPDKIEEVERIFSVQDNVGIVVHDVDIVNEQMVPSGFTLMRQLKSSGTLGAASQGLVHGCATAIRSSMSPLLLPVPNLQYGHDSWIHEVGGILDCRYVTDAALLAYRRHADNSSQSVLHASRDVRWTDMVIASKEIDIAAAYMKRANALFELSERILAIGESGYRKIPANVSYADALRRIEHARIGLELRARVIGRRQGIRKYALIWRMLRGGYYRYFLGWRSVAKDLIR